MHNWGNEDVDWQGINDAARFIAKGLSFWARLSVFDYKEKYGTVRIYCSFGWHGIYPIWRPNYCWYPKWWPMRLDFWLADTRLFKGLNRWVVRFHQKAYVYWYRKAVQKWPHLYKEIVAAADFGELFEGHIPGYKHSDFWTSV